MTDHLKEARNNSNSKVFIQDFINSDLNIKDYLKLISQDDKNIFGGFSYSAFRKFILSQLETRNLKYEANGKWSFKITCND